MTVKRRVRRKARRRHLRLTTARTRYLAGCKKHCIEPDKVYFDKGQLMWRMGWTHNQWQHLNVMGIRNECEDNRQDIGMIKAMLDDHGIYQ